MTKTIYESFHSKIFVTFQNAYGNSSTTGNCASTSDFYNKIYFDCFAYVNVFNDPMVPGGVHVSWLFFRSINSYEISYFQTCFERVFHQLLLHFADFWSFWNYCSDSFLDDSRNQENETFQHNIDYNSLRIFHNIPNQYPDCGSSIWTNHSCLSIDSCPLILLCYVQVLSCGFHILCGFHYSCNSVLPDHIHHIDRSYEFHPELYNHCLCCIIWITLHFSSKFTHVIFNFSEDLIQFQFNIYHAQLLLGGRKEAIDVDEYLMGSLVIYFDLAYLYVNLLILYKSVECIISENDNTLWNEVFFFNFCVCTHVE